MYQGKHYNVQSKKNEKGRRGAKSRRLLSLYLLAGVVFVYAVVRLGAGFINDARNARDNGILHEAVATVPPAPTAAVTPTAAKAESAQPSSVPSPTPAPSPTPELAPVTADFAALISKNPDICGWLYSPGTHIDYPVVQGSDNSYYLTHTAYNNVNDNGALFVDYRAAEDFSATVNVIYGHNMETDNMFGSLNNYDRQEYYQEHPVMYLLTPDGDYRLDICCAFVTYVTSPAFTFPATDGSYGLLLKDIENYNYIKPEVSAAEGDRLLCMSTCTVADDQRFMVIARMSPLD